MEPGFSFRIELRFTGAEADDGVIDMYDAAEALLGFQRSLALVTHLVINGRVITQAPSLEGARILVEPPSEGSWKAVAIVASLFGSLALAPRDSVLGHLVWSGYSYVMKQQFGIDVDFNKTIMESYEQMKKRDRDIPVPRESDFDAVIEKTASAFRNMHRPIFASRTAVSGIVDADVGYEGTHQDFDMKTFDFMDTSIDDDSVTEIGGWISSYNINSYKGRIFSPDYGRTIPFELQKAARSRSNVQLIADSLASNAVDIGNQSAFRLIRGFQTRSLSGRTKRINVTDVKGL